MKTAMVVVLIAVVAVFGVLSMTGKSMAEKSYRENNNPDLKQEKPEGYPAVVLGGGCFWCLEWEFNALPGVLYTESGYAGGTVQNPDYRSVTTGKTGHAEVVQVTYDPEKITYRAILDHFLRKAHDPTQLNRQGVDVGTQYRSAIFYANEEEKAAAQAAIAAADAEKVWKDKIVTTLEPLGAYFPAEDYHQNYYENYEKSSGAPHIRVLLKEKKKSAHQ